MQPLLLRSSSNQKLWRRVQRQIVVGLGLLALAASVHAQTARISDAWWTYEQDCDGDGNRAGTLAGGFARLNWFPDVANCNGTLMVREKVEYRTCGTSTWIPIYTNTLHQITGCVSTDNQYLDIEM